MEIRKWHVIDIYYDDIEEKEAQKEINRIAKNGYSVESLDSGSGVYDNCQQLIKWFDPRKK